MVRDGRVIAGRFEIDHLVAEGGMGAVYRALDRVSGQPVALKVMVAARIGDRSREDQDERFGREIRLVAAIEHPRVARYVGHGRDEDGLAFLAMEWLEGHDLAT